MADDACDAIVPPGENCPIFQEFVTRLARQYTQPKQEESP